MNKVILLDCLKDFTENAIKDILLPVKVQNENECKREKCADVYKMRLPDSKSSAKKAPYIIHTVLTGADEQKEGSFDYSQTVIRSIFCVYHPDEQEGALALLNLMERLRVELLRERVIGKQFELDIKNAKLETLIYPDITETAPYYLGEMVSCWKMPSIQRTAFLGEMMK